MMRHWQNPGVVARIISERVKDGQITTIGQWVSTIEAIGSLPAPVRAWLLDKITPEIGSDGRAYIESLLPEPAAGDWPVPVGVHS
jgi:hypothetical protein